MKKIIEGKKYDTETAELLFEYNNGPEIDNYYELFCLYKKNTGEYFIYGKTGVDEYWRPLADELAAQEYCLSKLSVDAYEKIFGEVVE